MNARQTELAVARLVRELPAELTRMGYSRETCILHTRYAVDALRELGVRARPLAARVMVGNAEWRRIAEELGHWPQHIEWTPETWCIGIGFGPDPRKERPGYDAHVIAVVNERWALDLTIDQASRPQHGINLSPHYWPVTPAFLRGDQPAQFRRQRHRRSHVHYDAMPDDRGFLSVPTGVWRCRRRDRRAPGEQGGSMKLRVTLTAEVEVPEEFMSTGS
jgi:hypothetical protein